MQFLTKIQNQSYEFSILSVYHDTLFIFQNKILLEDTQLIALLVWITLYTVDSTVDDLRN